MPSKKKKYNARFPAGRIKKIMQSDEEVGKVAQAVPIIISRTLELFVESLLNKTLRITVARNAKTLSPSHMRQCIMSENRFDFLRELVKNVPDISVAEEHAAAFAGSHQSSFGVPGPIASDDDGEFASGTSTPNAGLRSCQPQPAHSRPSATAALLQAACSSAAQLQRGAPGHHNGASHKRSATGRCVSPAPLAASVSIAANFYNEIDTSSNSSSQPSNGSKSVQSDSPPSATQQPASRAAQPLQRSASTPGDLPLNLSTDGKQPSTSTPIINFDFSQGMIVYASGATTPAVTSAAPVRSPVSVNVAIDGSTMRPLVSIDYSQLQYGHAGQPPAAAMPPAARPAANAPISVQVKPRRGRPPKTRQIVLLGQTPAVGHQQQAAAPLSAPLSAPASGGASPFAPQSDGAQRSHQKPASSPSAKSRPRSRRSSLAGVSAQAPSVAGGASLTVTMGACVPPSALMLPVPGGSCLDMDEDYDNI